MKSVLVVTSVLLFCGVTRGGAPRNVKRGLTHGENVQSSNGHTEAFLKNTQNSYSESFARIPTQSSEDSNQALQTPGIPPSLLSFSTSQGRTNGGASEQQRTPPFLDEDRNSVIQDSALQPQPSPPQFDIQNIPQGPGSAPQVGVTDTVISTGTAPAEGTVIGAPYLIAIHRNILRRYGIPVAKPYPVQVPRDVKVPVERPVPYKVDKPYEVRVNIPQPYAVDQPYPVPVDAPYPVRVPQAVGVPVPRPVPVHVPYPVGVPVPQPVAVRVPQPVGVPVPQHVPVPQPYPVPVAAPAPLPLPPPAAVAVAPFQAAPFAVPQPASFAVHQPASFAVHQPASFAFAQSAPLAVPQPAPLSFPAAPPLTVAPPAGLGHSPLTFSNIR